METVRTQHSTAVFALIVILLTSCNATMEPLPEGSDAKPVGDTSVLGTQCVSAVGWLTPLPPEYSWIESFADGHRDTIFASSRDQYPGASAKRFLGQQASGSSAGVVFEKLPLDSFRVCPTDSLYAAALAGDTLVVHRSTRDTIRLNYGTSASDSLVPPKVSFTNPASTAAFLDTIASGPWGRDAGIEVAHFNGDSVRFSLVAPERMSLAYHHATIDSQYACDGSATGTVRRMDYSSQDLPLLLRWSYLGAGVTGTTIDISLVARNRFGFADTLKLRSLVVAEHCSP